MALILSAASGNFNAGATWVGGVVPSTGDEARASTAHTITITANATCDEVSNAGTGVFTLNDGVTLTANVSNKSTTGSSVCVQFTASSPASGFIVGNLTGGPANGGSTTTTVAAILSSSGTLTITGNCTGGIGNFAVAARNGSTGILTITGNVIGGSGNAAFGANNSSAGSVNVTGNVTGGTVVASSNGLNNASTGIVAIVGICTGGVAGAVGANNASTGTVRATRAVGNAYGPANSAGLVAAVGISNVALGICEIEQFEFGTYGMSPTSGTGIRLKKVGTNVAIFNYCDTAGAKTLIDATTNAAMPAASDVRNGVSYASGAATGSCAVPAAGSVALGVPVDATLGTAVLTAAAIRAELATELGRIDAAVSSRLAPNGTLATVTNLTNAPASVTPSDIWSHATRTITGGLVDTATTLTNAPTVPSVVQIRAEMDSNSTQLAAIKAKTDLLETTRLAQCSTVATTGAQIAAALS